MTAGYTDEGSQDRPRPDRGGDDGAGQKMVDGTCGELRHVLKALG